MCADIVTNGGKGVTKTMLMIRQDRESASVAGLYDAKLANKTLSWEWEAPECHFANECNLPFVRYP